MTGYVADDDVGLNVVKKMKKTNQRQNQKNTARSSTRDRWHPRVATVRVHTARPKREWARSNTAPRTGHVSVGSCTSLTVTGNEHVAMPAVNVFTVVPTGNGAPLPRPAVCDTAPQPTGGAKLTTATHAFAEFVVTMGEGQVNKHSYAQAKQQ